MRNEKASGSKQVFDVKSLRKDGYTQVEINHLFKAIVLPKITYALPVYGASQVDLNTIQCFLRRCNKRRYTSELINIYDLLEKFNAGCSPKLRTMLTIHYMPFCRKSRVIHEVKITIKSITTD